MPAQAGNKVVAPLYPYEASANYCPSGLQPVVIGGVICCGKPNQSSSYQSVMAHPVQKKTYHKRATHSDCPIGKKGCS
ncbi:hypothetical protein DZK27_05215 [Rhodobacteraceae bacterium 63075]|nr:hypothetical protein DZK27_05215 [Rhodobacteraceae bacterium 63075]